jgi:hypothetical protein
MKSWSATRWCFVAYHVSFNQADHWKNLIIDDGDKGITHWYVEIFIHVHDFVLPVLDKIFQLCMTV